MLLLENALLNSFQYSLPFTCDDGFTAGAVNDCGRLHVAVGPFDKEIHFVVICFGYELRIYGIVGIGIFNR